ncbi:pyridoxal phosphate-dependent aminotransferase [Xanthovirga aplysinae]|uniref:pyridoxal phosphate-dependent aminotransferase n=1 Tax=Xanthovirga aplysinae TaxID=2529853 RepID=UPI0012BCF3F5|nr:aminotransferase class I/II-fold pyridoxal phosphate-dependent enzyme [Xanthovirga aplysinae]MTI30528.1 aminotransferase class I/II-fold pyridoxal phosphate-dependent enzyme [Xanthovirga aplysinae]
MIINKADRLGNVQEYYFSKKLREIAQMEERGEKVINLGIGSPDMAPSSATIKKLSEAAFQKNTHGYQNYKGIPQLRQAFSNWYNTTYNVFLNAETEVLPLLGSKEGIMHISMAFLNPGDGVLVPDPGYPAYAAASRLLGADLITYDLKEEDGWMPDLEALQKMDLNHVKLMWLNYPNMPTGAEANRETFEALIQFARKHKILLCHDNPYSLVLNKNQPLSILSCEGAKEVSIELNSLSKSHNMAGWRIGMVGGHKDYVEAIIKVKSNVDSGMFFPLQLAAVEALNNSIKWHNDRNKEYSKRKKSALSILELLKCKAAEEQVGMFLWAKIPDGISEVEGFIDNILSKAKVFLTPGFIFGSNGKRFIRISLCSNLNTLGEAHKRIQKVLSELDLEEKEM